MSDILQRLQDAYQCGGIPQIPIIAELVDAIGKTVFETPCEIGATVFDTYSGKIQERTICAFELSANGIDPITPWHSGQEHLGGGLARQYFLVVPRINVEVVI